MTNSTSPALTAAPSSKRTSVMRPPTSGRISAESTACSRPENSDHTRIFCGARVSTITEVGGAAAGALMLARGIRTA